jgi:hypothetical protein
MTAPKGHPPDCTCRPCLIRCLSTAWRWLDRGRPAFAREIIHLTVMDLVAADEDERFAKVKAVFARAGVKVVRAQ